MSSAVIIMLSERDQFIQILPASYGARFSIPTYHQQLEQLVGGAHFTLWLVGGAHLPFG